MDKGMNMEHANQIMICKVSPKWYKIIRSEYLVSGSLDSCFWSIDKPSSQLTQDVKDFQPGGVVLYICQMGDQIKVVGGGFFISWYKISLDEAWSRFGVRNGVTDFDDLVAEVKEHGGHRSSNIIAATLGNNFIFDGSSLITVPEEVSSHFKSGMRFILNIDDPTGRYLYQVAKKVYSQDLDKYGDTWKGVYYLASRSHFRSYSAGFYAKVRAAYKFKCAVTGSTIVPLLEVAQLRPFYDFKEQIAANGILLRSDFHRLFSLGYITLEYVTDDKVVIRTSSCLKSVGAAEYLEYEGKQVSLPDDKTAWPNPQYLEWHRKNCFENWLRLGGSHV